MFSDSKELKKDEIKEPTVIQVRITDEAFMANYRVASKELILVETSSLFKKKLTPEMLKQRDIGNCYFLSALANVLRRDPDFLAKILQITDDGKIAVSFYDANDVSKKYVYIIDPTRVEKPSATNAHTHDAIFLLEKAYAIHRLTLEPTIYSPTRKKVREAILKAGEAASKTDILELLDAAMAEVIRIQMERVDKFLSLEPEQLALQDDIYAIPVKQELEMNGYDKELARKAVLNRIMLETKAHYNIEIDTVKNLIADEKKDYLSALVAGFADVVFRSLTGTETSIVKIYRDDLTYFLDTFLVELHTLPLKECSKQTQASLVRMFGGLDTEEARLFHEAMQTIAKDQWKKFQIFAIQTIQAVSEKQLSNPKEYLLKALFNFANWSAVDAKQVEKLWQKLQLFVEENTLQKRGTGKYTPYQLELYDYLKENLSNGCYIVLGSKDLTTSTKKGVASNHAYEVVNCYQKGNSFFVVLRNPWSSYVRDYEKKDKIVDDKQMSVLGAVERIQIPKQNIAQSFLAKFTANSPPTNVALPNELKLSQDGYFSVELTDIHKYFNRCYVGGATQHVSPQLDIERKSSVKK